MGLFKKKKKQTKNKLLCRLVFRKKIIILSLSKACLFVSTISWKKSELHRDWTLIWMNALTEVLRVMC